MISGVMELAMRILVVMTLPKVLGELGIFLAEPAAWLGADALLIPSYYLLLRRQKQLLESNGRSPNPWKNPPPTDAMRAAEGKSAARIF